MIYLACSKTENSTDSEKKMQIDSFFQNLKLFGFFNLKLWNIPDILFSCLLNPETFSCELKNEYKDKVDELFRFYKAENTNNKYNLFFSTLFFLSKVLCKTNEQQNAWFKQYLHLTIKVNNLLFYQCYKKNILKINFGDLIVFSVCDDDSQQTSDLFLNNFHLLFDTIFVKFVFSEELFAVLTFANLITSKETSFKIENLNSKVFGEFFVHKSVKFFPHFLSLSVKEAFVKVLERFFFKSIKMKQKDFLDHSVFESFLVNHYKSFKSFLCLLGLENIQSFYKKDHELDCSVSNSTTEKNLEMLDHIASDIFFPDLQNQIWFRSPGFSVFINETNQRLFEIEKIKPPKTTCSQQETEVVEVTQSKIVQKPTKRSQNKRYQEINSPLIETEKYY